VLNRLGGEPEQFTEITGQEIQDYAWSPDSQAPALTCSRKTSRMPKKASRPRRPSPIVIDRYHFKQDIQGYLRNDERDALYLYDIATKKLEKLTTDKNVDEGMPVWSPDGAVDRLRQQPRRRSRSHRQHDVFVVAVQSRFGCEEADQLDWSRRRQAGLVAGFKAIAYTQGAKPELAPTASASRRRHPRWQGQLSGGKARSQRKPAVLSARWQAALSRQRRPLGVSRGVELNGDGAHRCCRRGHNSALTCQGGNIAVLHQDDTHTGEIYALEGSSLRKLTSVNDALLAELNLVPPKTSPPRAKTAQRSTACSPSRSATRLAIRRRPSSSFTAAPTARTRTALPSSGSGLPRMAMPRST
jgi:hypothetical protein